MQPEENACPLDHLAVRGRSNDEALSTREGVLTFADLDKMVGKLAAALLELGLTSGDRVASWLPKSQMAALLPLATARAGLINVPINPLLKRSQVSHILNDSKAKLVISAAARLATLKGGDLPLECMSRIEADVYELSERQDPLTLSTHDPQSLAALLYTSGSTGRPKGVMLSHANMWLGAISVAHYTKLAADDRVLAVLPFSFDYGQNQLLSSWAAGACAVPLEYLAARDLIRAVERYSITTLAGVPPLWVQLAEADWPPVAAASIRRITNSGGKLSPTITAKLRKILFNADVYLMYGLTEAFRSTYLDPDLVEVKPDSIGSAVPFAEILVVRPDGSLTDIGETGELVHAGPLVAQGYWKDPQRTAFRYKDAPNSSRYGGTAVWSGDLVKRDEDGHLFFVGRNDAMIKTNGNRVSPTEVEEAAIASGMVVEAVAMGEMHEKFGEAIVLIVRSNGPEREDKLRSFLSSELPNFMQPHRIVWRSDLPRSPNGKLDRQALMSEVGK